MSEPEMHDPGCTCLMCECEKMLHARDAQLAALRAENERLRLEIDGERKAKELALAGMASQTELYDGLKHKLRDMTASRDALAMSMRKRIGWCACANDSDYCCACNEMRAVLAQHGGQS